MNWSRFFNTKYFYIGLFAVSVSLIATMSFYKTSPAEPAMQTAEFGGVSLRIEYAITPEDRERGLGGRTSIPDYYGMLFVFPKDDKYGFWMKNMLIPVDIFWLDFDGHVVSIIKDIATSTYPNVFYPSIPARYVLETAAGFAREHNIATGTKLLFPRI